MITVLAYGVFGLVAFYGTIIMVGLVLAVLGIGEERK